MVESQPQQAGAGNNRSDSIGGINTPLGDDEILRRLEAAARRGKLAGFNDRDSSCLFSVAAFGDQFDYRLCAHSQAAPGSRRLDFQLRMLLKMPLIMAVVLIITVWPGVWLTDSMLTTYFSWYTIPTWIWYIPLTVLPIPWMWKRMHGRSKAAATEHAKEQIAKIAAELGAAPPDDPAA
ncbi:MAG: hypothetical protein JSR77_16250 [Planctomycetes bacterium]|nr:hypothetical protein [Planctomycetota bacterium]